jgi:putative two-component system response regulator
MRILIVDDDAMALEMLRHALTRAGHTVDSATNGREALEVLQRGNCRLVISDWEMPEMSGVELCRAIRAGDSAGYIYVVLLSARVGDQDTLEGLRAGADDFMTKPFNPAELALRVGIGERILSLETRDLTIFAMAKLAESRDPETGAHLERVCSYSRVLAQHLACLPRFQQEVDAAYARLIYLTSPLHDIGKVAIPDSVLLKPGRLSDREFEMMKEHTLLGAKTLDAALSQHPEARFLRMARDIAASHHERWDGTGYPNKLKGAEIPLCGRIVALADVYDALTTKRVYKGAFTHDVARSIIVEGRGTHFDPDIVDAYLANESTFVDIRARFADVQALADAA